MGMFDSVKIEMKCPYCGEVSEIEAQTKELECNLKVWKKGDFVTDKLNYLLCLADCVQPKCEEYVTKKNGYWGGFGRMFDVKIMLDEGKISDEYEVLNTTLGWCNLNSIVMTIRKWTEWLKGCGEAWKNQGNPQTNRGKEVRTYLLKVDKKPRDSQMDVAARAWKLYKKEKH